MSADPTQPGQPAARQPQEPPTQPAPRWQPPPPPPAAPPAGGRTPPGGRMPRPPVQEPQPDQRTPPGGRMPRPPVQEPQPQPDQRPQRQDRPASPPGEWAPEDTVQTPFQAPNRQPRPAPNDQPPQSPQQPQWTPRQPQNDQRPPAPSPQWQPAQAQPGQGQVPPGQAPPQGRSSHRRPRPRRVRRSFMAVFALIVIVVLLVIGDRVALAISENEFADQFAANGLPVKPSVDIEGFPFLTQLAAKDFHTVVITANNIPVSLPTGGDLSITSIKATIDGLHISSYSSTAQARVDHITATAFVSFGALAAAGGVGSGTGITLTPDGPNTVKITAGLGGVFSTSEEAQITQTGPQTISIKVVNNGTAVGSLLSSFGSFSFSLPAGVPPSLRITSLTLNSQGLTVTAAATNATFSKS